MPESQSAGQGMCVLQEDTDSGFAMCLHSVCCSAWRSSKATAWMQSTVRLVKPDSPQLDEHFCHSPAHHLCVGGRNRYSLKYIERERERGKRGEKRRESMREVEKERKGGERRKV